jgi:hypothetical protein
MVDNPGQLATYRAAWLVVGLVSIVNKLKALPGAKSFSHRRREYEK